jgi:DNA invertase Pin-like site-specific DNA recombinase
MRFLAYLRVSTDEQTASGAGLAAQKDACIRHAESCGTLEAVFADEGLSGAVSLDKRFGLLEAISQLGKGDVLLVAKRDRLGRDPILVAMIESAVVRKGARIVSAAGEGTEGDDPASVLMRRMVDAFAEYERLIIGARTKAALQAKKRRGERVGHIPFGYRLCADGVHLEVATEEQECLRQIAGLQTQGLSLRQIAAELNARGTFNRGAKWNHVAVSRVFKQAA